MACCIALSYGLCICTEWFVLCSSQFVALVPPSLAPPPWQDPIGCSSIAPPLTLGLKFTRHFLSLFLALESMWE